MAISKFNFTDLDILRVALVMSSGSTCDEAIKEVKGDNYDASKHNAETFARKVSHKIHVTERAKAKPATKSKMRIANENIANSYLASLNSGDVFNLADLMNANPGVTTYAKAAAIVNILVERGAIVHHGSLNGKSNYKVA